LAHRITQRQHRRRRIAEGLSQAADRAQGQPICRRAGEAGGRARTGSGSAARPTAIGAVINLAARLCAEATDGQILVSGRLASSIGDVAEIEDLGERQLRGMIRPAPIANLRGPRL
jgi:class 3 adenylate cyclase